MSNLGTSPSNSTQALPRLAQVTSPRPYENGKVKQWLVSCARKLHEKSIAFLLMVKAFRGLQHLGINLTPNHFYWPVPDITELEKREWNEYPLPGHSFRMERQARFARELASTFAEEYDFPSRPTGSSYHYNNGYFEAVDAELTYSLVRRTKPARIVEIGTGYSTRVLATALERNSVWEGVEGKLISIDPSAERFPGTQWSDRVQQVPSAVQDIDLSLFETLTAGDILFIDSSHVVATGSDVIREYLQIFPQLRHGVLVHVHDIFLPFDYPRESVLHNLWFWSEQYLLQAFLSFNQEFEVLWASSAMQAYYPELLEHCFPHWRHSFRKMPESKRRFVPTADGDRVWPSSFWMRRI